MNKFFPRILRHMAVVAALLLAACGSLPQRTEIRTEQVARLEVVGGSGAAVSLDGIRFALIPEGQHAHRVEVPAGWHQLDISKDGTTLYSQRVMLTKGTVKSVRVGK